MITIIDYGLGNLTSILNMHKRLGIVAQITKELKVIEKATKFILPGVGHFDHGMEQLNNSGISSLLNKKVITEKKPILGICLGAQLMTKRSEEGTIDGLGWINAETIRFNFQNGLNHLKIPHMGWSDIQIAKKSPLLNDLPEKPRFYFVHAYHFALNKEEVALTKSEYGYEFTSGFQKENIYGVQFHPEKSHKFGMKVLQNFASI